MIHTFRTHTFLVFAGRDYYPGAAFQCYVGERPTLESAKAFADELITPQYDWAQVVRIPDLAAWVRGVRTVSRIGSSSTPPWAAIWLGTTRT